MITPGQPADPGFLVQADLSTYGPAQCLEALRGHCAVAHAPFPEFRGWEERAELGALLRQVLHGRVSAPPGDLVLAVPALREDGSLMAWIHRIACFRVLSRQDVQLAGAAAEPAVKSPELFLRPVWVSVGSHRARHTLARIVGRVTPEYGVWPKGAMPRGEYHCIPGRFAGELRQVKSLRVLAGRPGGGRVFRRWELSR